MTKKTVGLKRRWNWPATAARMNKKYIDKTSVLDKNAGALSHAEAPKFPLYYPPHFLSREKLHKVLAAKIPKLVQNYHLIFLKKFAIIIIQGKGKDIL